MNSAPLIPIAGAKLRQVCAALRWLLAADLREGRLVHADEARRQLARIMQAMAIAPADKEFLREHVGFALAEAREAEIGSASHRHALLLVDRVGAALRHVPQPPHPLAVALRR